MSVTSAYQSLVKGKALEQRPKLWNFFIYLSIYLFIHLFIYLFIYLYIYLFIRLFIYLFICLFIYLFIYSLFKVDDKNRYNHL